MSLIQELDVMVRFQMKDWIWRILTICLSIAVAVGVTVDVPNCPTSARGTLIPNPVDCRKFFVCIQGIAYPISCPYGLGWNPSSKQCSTLSTCGYKQNTQLPTGSQKSIGAGQWNAACPLKDNLYKPIHLPHPGDCSKFLKCSFGRSFEVYCPYGLHWNVGANRCDSPLIAKCGRAEENTMSTTPSETTTVKTTIPVCPASGVKNFGIPGQCDKFFSCSQGKLFVVNCRKGRQWSEKVGGCTDSNLAGCTSLSNVPSSVRRTQAPPLNQWISSSMTQRPPAPTLPDACTPGVIYLSNPIDCHKFFVCDNGKPVEMSCPKGLFFSPATSSCQWTNIDC